ncbi:FAD-binding oxidoreductase, partial [Streptococcus pyogenes]|uniref:FAD-binding oxidoreductase n=1 Tax=Streptococcus pyogenes TaxID=1314 RepID=UPI003DA030FE
STDASIYRVLPQAVVFPRTEEDVLGILGVARRMHVPVTMRGAGTSIAGNAVGEGIVVDTSRHFADILSIDPDERVAVVRPGVTIAQLQA